MQYSPYPQSMNPYQVIYNNGGSAAYNPTWGYTDAFAHVLGYRSELPLGYTRQQYNEERALAAESMWKSPLLGLGSFAVSTASMWAIWGSPLKGLVETFGGNSARTKYLGGFYNNPSEIDVGNAVFNVRNLQATLAERTNAGAGKAELKALKSQLESATSEWEALRLARNEHQTSTLGKIGTGVRYWENFKGEVGKLTNSLFKNVVTNPVADVADFGVSRVGRIFEGVANKWSGGRLDAWTTKAGSDLLGSEWLANLGTTASNFTKEEKALAGSVEELTKSLSKLAPESSEAASIIAKIEKNSEKLSELRGIGGIKGMWAKTAGKLNKGLTTVGTVLKNGGGISGILGTVAKGGIGLAGGLAGWFASMYLNPITMAEMYLMEQTIGYTADTYQNYQAENEIKRNLMAKGSRILSYGFTDSSRGLEAGLSETQRNRIVQKVRDMAEIGANRGDLFGLGSMSLLGGHARYSERLRELKSILNVGTDMGFFDMSKSIDDFEKKFEQTVKTVDKLSKFLKKTKGEVMTMMANVQQTEGLYNMSDIQSSVLKKDYAARLTGADITTAMQESAAGAQMARSQGFSAALGASVMSSNRVLMSNALRAGNLDRQTLFNLGGEQGFIASMQQATLNMFMDDEMMVEGALDYAFNPATGRYEKIGKRSSQFRNASGAELTRMAWERKRAKTRRSWSRIRREWMAGGELYDAMHYYKEDLRNGKIDHDTLLEQTYNMVRQRQHDYYGSGMSKVEADELLAQGMASDYGMNIEAARILVKNVNGGFNNFKLQNDLAVSVSRYKEGYEKSGVGAWSILTSNFKRGAIGYFAAAAGASVIGGYAGGAAGAAFAGTSAFIASAGSDVATTLLGIAANRYGWFGGQNTAFATNARNRIIASMAKYGYNPNYVMSYLTNSYTTAETLAGMNPASVSNALLVASKLGGSTSSFNIASVRASSDKWQLMEQGLGSMDSATIQIMSRAMDRTNNWGFDDRGTLSKYLDSANIDAEIIKSAGIDVKKSAEIRKYLKDLSKGRTVDISSMGAEDIRNFGKIIGMAIQKANPDYIQTSDLFKRIIIDKEGASEFDYRQRHISSFFNAQSYNSSIDELYNAYGVESFRNAADRNLGTLLNSKYRYIDKGVYYAGKGSTMAKWAGAGLIALGSVAAVAGGVASLHTGGASLSLVSTGGAAIAKGAALYGAGYLTEKFYVQEQINKLGNAKAAAVTAVDKMFSKTSGYQDAISILEALDPSNSNLSAEERRERYLKSNAVEFFGDAFASDSIWLNKSRRVLSGQADKELYDLTKSLFINRATYATKSSADALMSKLYRELDDSSVTSKAVYKTFYDYYKRVYGESSLGKEYSTKAANLTYDDQTVKNALIAYFNKNNSTEIARLITQGGGVDKAISEYITTGSYKDAKLEAEAKIGNASSGENITAKTADSCLKAAMILRECMTRLGFF